jgi:2-hydroxychromene-2-carboxylate isomerase
MAHPMLEFWFDFASTYSYLSAVRVRALAQAANVALRFKPFLLGPIFKTLGWDTSPFSIYEAKGRHMWRDLERLAADFELPFRRPVAFPQSSLLASRWSGWRRVGARTIRLRFFAPNLKLAKGSTTRPPARRSWPA